MASTPELTLWRLVRPEFAPGLDGKGAELYGGRWNSPGLPAVYCARHLSLAVLEYFVHLPAAMRRAGAMPPMSAVRLQVSADAVETLSGADPARLADAGWCRDRGDAWLREARSVGLSVPSAVIPQESNVVFNSRHPDFGLVRRIEVMPFRFDPRLGG